MATTIDAWRVLPHRSIQKTYSDGSDGWVHTIHTHKPCGQELPRQQILANWCPHCDKPINKAAYNRRGITQFLARQP